LDGEITSDVIVVGTGVAGLSCALKLLELGIKPLVVSAGEGNTPLAQGGIAAAVTDDDSPRLHALDTEKAGRLLNDPYTVSLITASGKEAISHLLSWGVEFDREEGFYALALEAAHSKRRIFKVKDYTGRAIYEALFKRLVSFGVKPFKGELLELYTEGDRVSSLLVRSGENFLTLSAKIFVLATGGAANIYARSSNRSFPSSSVLGNLLRIGVPLRDTEFVQFHPTVLKGTNLLISEAVRGEGAHLINSEGERFVYELAPRDTVSRAIFNQMAAGREVFLDFSPIVRSGRRIEGLFPQIFGFLKRHGIDPYQKPVPVEPAAHYFIGGAVAAVDGKTALKNLYVIGEAANTGFHGANRLASNSLLEGVVCGVKAAHSVALELPFLKVKSAKVKTAKQTGLPKGHEFNLKRLGEIMWRYAGVVRDKGGLEFALEELSRMAELYLKSFQNPEGKLFFDTLLVAKAVVLNALRRNESRGCHYRTDHPSERNIYERVRFEITLSELL
jgi:L-aspartate oxidase